MVAYYEQGNRPIPRVVALATRGLDLGLSMSRSAQHFYGKGETSNGATGKYSAASARPVKPSQPRRLRAERLAQRLYNYLKKFVIMGLMRLEPGCAQTGETQDIGPP